MFNVTWFSLQLDPSGVSSVSKTALRLTAAPCGNDAALSFIHSRVPTQRASANSDRPITFKQALLGLWHGWVNHVLPCHHWFKGFVVYWGFTELTALMVVEKELICCMAILAHATLQHVCPDSSSGWRHPASYQHLLIKLLAAWPQLIHSHLPLIY